MTICHVCQTPVDVPIRTMAGEPAHAECIPDAVETARESTLEGCPPEATEEYRAGWIDATIAFDRRLTDGDDPLEYPFGVTD